MGKKSFLLLFLSFFQSHQFISVSKQSCEVQLEESIYISAQLTSEEIKTQRDTCLAQNILFLIVVKKTCSIIFTISIIFKCAVHSVKYIHVVVQPIYRNLTSCKTKTW